MHLRVEMGEIPIKCTWDVGPSGVRMIAVLLEPDSIPDVLALRILDELYRCPFPVVWMSGVLLKRQFALTNDVGFLPSERTHRTQFSKMSPWSIALLYNK